MSFYLVKISAEVVVFAENASAAERTAAYHHYNIESDEFTESTVREIVRLSDLPHGFDVESRAYGDDDERRFIDVLPA